MQVQERCKRFVYICCEGLTLPGSVCYTRICRFGADFVGGRKTSSCVRAIASARRQIRAIIRPRYQEEKESGRRRRILGGFYGYETCSRTPVQPHGSVCGAACGRSHGAGGRGRNGARVAEIHERIWDHSVRVHHAGRLVFHPHRSGSFSLHARNLLHRKRGRDADDLRNGHQRAGARGHQVHRQAAQERRRLHRHHQPVQQPLRQPVLPRRHAL